MTIVDLSQLSETQLAGLKYGFSLRLQQVEAQVAQVTAQNAQITQSNSVRPINTPEQPLIPVPSLPTLQSYADDRMTQVADQDYQQLLYTKESVFKEKFYSADPEIQAEVLEKLGVPNIVE
jgi:Zn-dependent oligopeptidase